MRFDNRCMSAYLYFEDFIPCGWGRPVYLLHFDKPTPVLAVAL